MDYQGPERRSSPMEMQQAVLKLISKVESMERNIDIKLEAVFDKIENINTGLTQKIELVDKKLSDHCDDEDEINNVLDTHDKKINKAEIYVEKIHRLESKYIELEDRVNKLQKQVDDHALVPTKSKAAFVDTFLLTLRNVLFTALATGLVGLFGYLLISYIKG